MFFHRNLRVRDIQSVLRNHLLFMYPGWPPGMYKKCINVSSRMLNRDVKNIAKDVKYLAQVGLVEKRRSKDEKKILRLP